MDWQAPTLAALAAVATIYTVLGPRDQDADGPDYAPVIVDDEAPTATRASEDENGSQLAILPNVAADDAAWARAQAQATLAALQGLSLKHGAYAPPLRCANRCDTVMRRP